MSAEPITPLQPLCVGRASDLGPAVRARRREQSLRIDDAASLSGVSVDLLSRLENGKGSVRLDKLLTVLDGLGLALVVGPKDHPWMQSVPRPGHEGAERS
jgi:transcriptional regulator with XRE-family HTH domain